MGAVLGHEKWYFEGEVPPLDVADLGEPRALVLISVVAVLTAGAAWLWRRREGRDLVPHPARLGATDDRLATFYALVPAILGAHLAVPLLVNGANGDLFAPSNELGSPWKFIVGVIETGIGIAIFYGALTRLAAALLALLWVAAPSLIGLEAALENVHDLGFAAYFFWCGRGPLAVDRLLMPRLEPGPEAMARGFPALRVLVGLSLVVVACTEKLMNLDLAEAFLRQYPINFMPKLGMAMSDRAFATAAGSVELLIGAWLMLGLFPRLVVLVAWLPFNITLTVFDSLELVGHLPYYGFMAVLLVHGGSPEARPLLVRGLRREILPI
jgi:uncharacterized membrane protein YphA (DoxX/SURF4 family)